jgi:uncharacterized membrane protein
MPVRHKFYIANIAIFVFIILFVGHIPSDVAGLRCIYEKGMQYFLFAAYICINMYVAFALTKDKKIDRKSVLVSIAVSSLLVITAYMGMLESNILSLPKKAWTRVISLTLLLYMTWIIASIIYMRRVRNNDKIRRVKRKK